ncbi:MAG: hypothetical protein H6704_15325 [Myxococcales bacterium]|nr:hypothetical protein [Myxococcales bacterium]
MTRPADAAPADAAPADAAPGLDAAPADAAPADAAPGLDAAAAVDAETLGPDAARGDAAPPGRARRLVIAGDSWSTGSVQPTRQALADADLGDVAVTWEQTAIAGSQAREWVADHEGKLQALTAALDADPPADVLLLYLGGNDFNFAMVDRGWSQRRRDAAIDQVEADLQRLVDFARAGRPHLTVVLVGYDFFDYPKMRLTYGFDIAPNLADLNAAYVEMARRKLAIARRTEGVEYAHNLGLLQHRWGDAQRAYPIEPFVVPAYEPGFFPAPGVAPAYDPLPGGNIAFPGPDAALFDGLHLTDEAMRVLVDHVLDQGLAAALRGEGWPR